MTRKLVFVGEEESVISCWPEANLILMEFNSPAVVQGAADARPGRLLSLLLLRISGRGHVDLVVNYRAIPSNALVPVGPRGPDAGGVVEIVLLELFAAAQVLEDPLGARDFLLDERPDRGVGALVQIVVDAVHAGCKSTGTVDGQCDQGHSFD